MNTSILEKIERECPQTYIDFALAKELLKNDSSNSAATALICHMSLAVKLGHLCVKVNEQEVLPKIEEIWEFEDFSLSSDEENELLVLIKEGAQQLPIIIFSRVNSNTQLNEFSTPIIRFNDLFFFQKHWIREATCLQTLQKLLNQPPNLKIDRSIFNTQLNKLLEENRLLPEQASAIAQLENQSIILISGGPGTGKTYTAGLLLQVFWNSLSDEQKIKCKIAFAAPTGKAAANLQGSLSKINSHLDLPTINAKTLHSLLGIKSRNNQSPPLLSSELLIVDECSMIDIQLMATLLQALKPGSRLIMLGDSNQLPPVEAGSFFSDLTKCYATSHLVQLKKCLRTDLLDIVNLSEEIKKGDCKAALQQLKESKASLSFNELPDASDYKLRQKKLKDHAWPHLIKFIHHDSFTPNVDNFRILTPLRQGSFGVIQLNNFFFKESLKEVKKNHPMVIPIIIVSNDSKRELYNGDVGYLFKQKPEDSTLQQGDYALIGSRKIPALLLPKFEYAYCLSIHKSQGSEFNEILLLLPEGSERFGRELLYTGVTRARKKIDLWSTEEIFNKVVSKQSYRLSSLETRT